MTPDPDPGAAAPPLAEAAPVSDGVADKVVRGGAIRTVGFAITNLIALGAAMILSRHLGDEGFGLYGSVMALITIIYGITDAGLNVVGARELSLVEPGEPRRRLTGVLLGIRLVLTTAGVGLAVLVALLLPSFTSTQVAGTFIAGVGSIAIAAVATLTLPALVELQNVRLLLVEVARQVIQLVGTVACVVAGSGLVAFFYVQASIGPLVLLGLPLLIGAGVYVRPRYDRREWTTMTRIALPIAIASVLSVLYLKVIVLIGSVVLSRADQGLLVMTSRAVEILSGLPLVIVGVVLPVVSLAARDDAARLRYVAQRLLESALILGILISLPLSFGARTVLRVLGGDAFLGATPALEIQAWMLLTVFVVQGSIVLLLALHQNRAIVLANVIGLASVVVLGSALLPAYGVEGGAVAVVAADVILMGAMLRAVLRSRLRGQLELGATPRILLAAALAIGAGLLCPGPDVLVAAVSTIAFAVLLLVLRGAPPEARALLLSPLARARGAAG
ncbi:MAG: oligosaccharide flippase family protein [Patulibacter minatonensis]